MEDEDLGLGMMGASSFVAYTVLALSHIDLVGGLEQAIERHLGGSAGSKLLRSRMEFGSGCIHCYFLSEY